MLFWEPEKRFLSIAGVLFVYPRFPYMNFGEEILVKCWPPQRQLSIVIAAAVIETYPFFYSHLPWAVGPLKALSTGSRRSICSRLLALSVECTFLFVGG